mmetsp:Transcript_9870/g.24014  ORF Transcript_9870/g.24014 Transcript_9870/m.24014 type:complete len:225 (+) Transcript_9870:854-1528(+)
MAMMPPVEVPQMMSNTSCTSRPMTATMNLRMAIVRTPRVPPPSRHRMRRPLCPGTRGCQSLLHPIAASSLLAVRILSRSRCSGLSSLPCHLAHLDLTTPADGFVPPACTRIRLSSGATRESVCSAQITLSLLRAIVHRRCSAALWACSACARCRSLARIDRGPRHSGSSSTLRIGPSSPLRTMTSAVEGSVSVIRVSVRRALACSCGLPLRSALNRAPRPYSRM